MPRDLVDELVLLIHPLVLGSGRRLFADSGSSPSAFELVDSATTGTGVLIAPRARSSSSLRPRVEPLGLVPQALRWECLWACELAQPPRYACRHHEPRDQHRQRDVGGGDDALLPV